MNVTNAVNVYNCANANRIDWSDERIDDILNTVLNRGGLLYCYLTNFRMEFSRRTHST